MVNKICGQQAHRAKCVNDTIEKTNTWPTIDSSGSSLFQNTRCSQNGRREKGVGGVLQK